MSLFKITSKALFFVSLLSCNNTSHATQVDLIQDVAPGFSDHPAIKTSNIISYNLWAPGTRNGFCLDNSQDDVNTRSSQQATLLLNELKKDSNTICFLQEATDSIKNLFSAPYQIYTSGSLIKKGGGVECFYNAILFDATQWTVVYYQKNSLPLGQYSIDTIPQQGRIFELFLKNNITSQEIAAINVHLSWSPHFTQGLDQSLAATIQSIKQNHPAATVVIAGDFNQDISWMQNKIGAAQVISSPYSSWTGNYATKGHSSKINDGFIIDNTTASITAAFYAGHSSANAISPSSQDMLCLEGLREEHFMDESKRLIGDSMEAWKFFDHVAQDVYKKVALLDLMSEFKILNIGEIKKFYKDSQCQSEGFDAIVNWFNWDSDKIQAFFKHVESSALKDGDLLLAVYKAANKS